MYTLQLITGGMGDLPVCVYLPVSGPTISFCPLPPPPFLDSRNPTGFSTGFALLCITHFFPTFLTDATIFFFCRMVRSSTMYVWKRSVHFLSTMWGRGGCFFTPIIFSDFAACFKREASYAFAFFFLQLSVVPVCLSVPWSTTLSLS